MNRLLAKHSPRFKETPSSGILSGKFENFFEGVPWCCHCILWDEGRFIPASEQDFPVATLFFNGSIIAFEAKLQDSLTCVLFRLYFLLWSHWLFSAECLRTLRFAQRIAAPLHLRYLQRYSFFNMIGVGFTFCSDFNDLRDSMWAGRYRELACGRRHCPRHLPRVFLPVPHARLPRVRGGDSVEASPVSGEINNCTSWLWPLDRRLMQSCFIECRIDCRRAAFLEWSIVLPYPVRLSWKK